LLVAKPEEGASLARALGAHAMVLMRRHGVTVVGMSVRDCVYRAIQTCRNADFQVRALSFGAISSLSEGETRLCDEITRTTTAVIRSWDFWAKRVVTAGGLPQAAAQRAAAKSKPKRAAAKTAKKSKSGKARRR